MKKFNAFHPLFLSPFSVPLYKDVAKNWKGLGFSYLLLLALIPTIALMAIIISYTNSIKPVDFVENIEKYEQNPESLEYFINNSIVSFVGQFPEMKFEKCKLIADIKNQPVIIKDMESDTDIITLDTTGKVTTPQYNSQTPITITQDFIHIIKQNGEARTIYFADHCDKLEGQIINSDTVLPFIEYGVAEFKGTFFIIATIAIYIIIYLVLIFQSLIYGFCGLIIGLIVKSEYDYPDFVRFATIAITPLIVILMILNFVTISGGAPISTIFEPPIPFVAEVMIDLTYLAVIIFITKGTKESK